MVRLTTFASHCAGSLIISIALALLGLVCFASPAKAVVPKDIGRVTATLAAQSGTASNISFSWDPVAPVNGGSISYDIEKSTDGGLTFSPTVNVTGSPWTDTNSGTGVPNYTNVIYRLRAKETLGPTNYYSANYKYSNTFPPDINAHDNYQLNTDTCHLCHSAHQAQVSKLLNQPTASAVCLTCHGGGTNSKYNVIDGYTVINGGNARSLGGAFNHNAVAGDVWNGAPTTSAHKVNEITAGAAPGGFNINQSLGCTTCHSGHNTGNYRMIKKSIPVPTGTNTVTTVNLNIQAGAANSNAASGESPVYISGTTALCQACHTDYNVAGGSGGSGTAPVSQYSTPGAYRHAVGVTPVSKNLTTTLPLEGTARNNTDKIVCLTCHYAHGTVASGLTTTSVVSGDGTTFTTANSTSLKRMNGMGACEDCHKK